MSCWRPSSLRSETQLGADRDLEGSNGGHGVWQRQEKGRISSIRHRELSFFWLLQEQL